MKRLLATLGILLILPLAFAFGCKKDTDDEGDWIEVQSVSYKFETGEVGSFTSYVKWNTTSTYVIKEAYDLAAENMKLSFETSRDYNAYCPSAYSRIDTNRNEYFNNLNKFVNKTYYINIKEYTAEYDRLYIKQTWRTYTIEYVYIQLLENNTLKIKANGSVIEVQPLLYDITYFEN